MQGKVFIVPGIGNSGPDHWQSRWQEAHPHWQRLAVADWHHVACDDWVAALDRQIGDAGPDCLVVAHSLGCLAVANWARARTPCIRGALLVAVPGPAVPAFPAAATGFAPLPLQPLPFPSIVVGSSNDPYDNTGHGRRCAEAWGSRFVAAGQRGHLNAQSGLGAWPDGLALLQSL